MPANEWFVKTRTKAERLGFCFPFLFLWKKRNKKATDKGLQPLCREQLCAAVVHSECKICSLMFEAGCISLGSCLHETSVKNHTAYLFLNNISLIGQVCKQDVVLNNNNGVAG